MRATSRRDSNSRATPFSSCFCRLCHLLIFLLSYSITIKILPCSAGVEGTASAVQPVDIIKDRLRAILLRRRETTQSFGFYYGIPRTTVEPFGLDQRISGTSDSDTKEKESKKDEVVSLAESRYLDVFESIGKDVEKWADDMLRNSDVANGILGVENANGWTEVFCAKAFRKKFNRDKNSTIPVARQWVKWMQDSRGRNADPNDNQNHPCMKLVATIDAPFSIVCRYLSEKERFREYNSLLIDQEDVEILTPHSKICWSQTKKLRKSDT